MSSMLHVFRYELRRNFRRKGFLFATFGIPLISMVILFGYQAVTGKGIAAPPPKNGLDFGVEAIKRAGYVDLSGAIGGTATPESGGLARYDDETAARAALDSGQIDAYYVVAPDYLQTGDVTLVLPRLDVGKLDFGVMRALLLNSLAGDVPDAALYQRLVHPSTITTVSVGAAVAQSGPQVEGSSFFIVYIFAIILLISLLTTNNYLLRSVIEEKESRLIEILVSSLTPMQLLAGKILALGLLGLVQIVVWLGSTFLIAQLSGQGALTGVAAVLLASFQVPIWLIPLLLIYFVLAYLLFAAFFSIIGALSNSEREGTQYTAILVLPAVVPLWFTQIFASTPDGPIPTALSLFPLTAPLAMVQRLAISVVPTWQVLASIALLALTLVAMLWLAGRVFRVQTLLAGQAPRLRDLPALIRG